MCVSSAIAVAFNAFYCVFPKIAHLPKMFSPVYLEISPQKNIEIMMKIRFQKLQMMWSITLGQFNKSEILFDRVVSATR